MVFKAKKSYEVFQSPRPFGRGKNLVRELKRCGMSVFQSPRPFGRGKNIIKMLADSYTSLFQSPRPFGRGKNRASKGGFTIAR